jgi:hypothetical protein
MKLLFDDRLVEPNVRWLEDLRDVAYDISWMNTAPHVVRCILCTAIFI